MQLVLKLFKKNKILVKSDTRCTSKQILDMVGISKAFALRFLRNNLKMKKESTSLGGPHICSMRSKSARKLSKRFPRYNQNFFMHVVTADDSTMHYFELHGKISNQHGSPKCK